MFRLSTAIIFTAIILGGCSLLPNLYNENKNISLPVNTVNLAEVSIADVKLQVEVARTAKERAQGLSNRNFLPANQGMIFIFDRAGEYTFWMKGMRFPLDFMWIANGKVVEVTTNVEAPTAENSVPITVKPKVPVTSVIEVNAGWVAESGVEVGQEVLGLTGL